MLFEQPGEVIFGKSRVIGHLFQRQLFSIVIVDIGQQAVEFLVIIVTLLGGIICAGEKGVVMFPADRGQNIDLIGIDRVFPEGDAGREIEIADLHKPGIDMFVDSCVRPFRQKAGVQQHRLQGAVIVEAG